MIHDRDELFFERPVHNLGYVALAQGDSSQAAALFGEGLALQREIGQQQGIAECLAAARR
ncbi:MAG: hypothetical protein M3R61_02110 [Chloroflexota bacterium]|nr:hypothetical protein [Chloroflexota bacterium]